MKFLPFLFFCFTSVSVFKASLAFDTLAPNQTLKDNDQTLVSTGGAFELGFFSPWNSSNRYAGIWFKKVPQKTVVWVANRDSPLTDFSGVLTITSTGNIVILNSSSNTPIWSSNTSTSHPVLQLLDTGNLVLKAGAEGSYTWQSFDHPSDTLLPGMKLGWNLRTNQNWFLTAWKSLQDPSTGDFTYKVDPRGLPQLVLHKGSAIQYRSGPWDGVRFGGDPKLQDGAVFRPAFVYNTTDVYYTFQNSDTSIISRFVVNQSGSIQHHTWNERGEWVNILIIQRDRCDTYANCGPYGLCNINKVPICFCPTGFTPKQPQYWNLFEWSDGCVRKTPLNCSANEGFRKFSSLKLPDNSQVLEAGRLMSLEECKVACLRNCSCVAYARTDASGCVVWSVDLLDVREFSETGQDLYIRMAASEFGSNKNNTRTVVIVSVSVVSVVVMLVAASWVFLWKRNFRRSKVQQPSVNDPNEADKPSGEEDDIELPFFDFHTIASATDNYSFTNKIGEGGYGPVYKGTLSTGQQIAVKRLSKDSRQGLVEFKNEVILIAKLQHRNLVRLLGCCIQGQDKMLIYEFVDNRSLDLYIFEQTRGSALDWGKRFNIIIGIVRGLLYLHRDSRLRIIHRDLKASNVLLDCDMIPKISDFGLARTFGGDQTEASTTRVIGTYGYMPPEYALEGLFSVKSDVFSFGVLVLEIISGVKNRGFYHPDHDYNLLGHAWNLWNEGRIMELMDPLMEKPVPESEILRSIQVGLLCVQQRPEDRPTMSSVVLMLDSEDASLPQPQQPGFYAERFLMVEAGSSSTGKNPIATNEVTITMLEGR